MGELAVPLAVAFVSERIPNFFKDYSEGKYGGNLKGMAFCDSFGLQHDKDLYYETNNELAHNHILRKYNF